MLSTALKNGAIDPFENLTNYAENLQDMLLHGRKLVEMKIEDKQA